MSTDQQDDGLAEPSRHARLGSVLDHCSGLEVALMPKSASDARIIEDRYGLTPEQYVELVKLQGGACAICRRVPPMDQRAKRRLQGLCVDHCHTTGTVRGLLCSACNTTLGLMQDDPERLRQAARYLER